MFQIEAVSPELRFLKLAYDAKLCLHYHFQPTVRGIDENIRIKVYTFTLREG